MNGRIWNVHTHWIKAAKSIELSSMGALWELSPIGLIPAEILFWRHLAIPGTYITAKTSLLDRDEWLTQYVLYIQEEFKNDRKYAQWYQSAPPEIQMHAIHPGDEVFIKIFSWKSKLEPKWEGPYTVLLSFFC